MIADDGLLVGTPRVGAEPEALLKAHGFFAVDDVEVKGELLFHLLLPLAPQGGGTEDQHAPDPPAEHQLAEDQAAFDGLAQSHAVREEQGHAGHAEGSE
ncbi:hypothetical protein D3C72_1964480 [compost metagenome]